MGLAINVLFGGASLKREWDIVELCIAFRSSDSVYN
jgi:hypothetical protein